MAEIFSTITGESGFAVAGESGVAIAGDTVSSIVLSNADIQQFNFSVDLLQAILWEYNAATNLQSIIKQKQDWYNVEQADFWENWIANVFNLATANEFGLSVWSIILNLPLFIAESPTPTDVLSFGFDDGSGQFDMSNFGNQNGETNELPLETKRLALQLRYFQLCSSGTVPEINRFMNYIFSDFGRVVLLDNNDMTQQYVFFFPLTWDLQYLFDNFDILPRPAGVKTTYRSTNAMGWGFDASSGQFDQSNFAF